jgi:beta-N-acetylhexosaminidase
MVMVSHAAYSSASNEPASVSTYWITDILARKMGYRGLIVSDDMEMGGILKYMGMADAAVGSLAAGIHAVEVCRDPALVFAAYEGILREAEKSPAFARLLRRAAAKVQSIATARKTPVPGDAAVAKMRTAIERFTAQVAKATAA